MYRFEKKRIEIERLEKQLESRKPKGRDPVGRRFDEISRTATALPEHTTLDQTEAEFNTWKPQKQIQFFNTLLYPVLFGGSDLTWSIQVNTKEEEIIRNQENLTPKRRRSKKKQKKSAMQICVNFKGFEEPLELIPGEFKVQCDRRQLHIVQQIASDFQAHKELPDAEKFSLGLMAIRSAQLLWKKDEQELYKKDRQYNQRKKAKKAERLIKKALLKQLPQPPWKTYKKDKKTEKTQRLSKEQLSKEPLPKKEALPQQPPQPPWKLYRLCLHITIDSRLTTAEGTEIVRQEKTIETNKALAGLKQNYEEQLQEDSKVKESSDDLVKKQNARKSKIKAATTSLIRLQKPTPPRPSKPPYQGQPHILVGVGFSRDRIVGVVVMDMKTKVVLEYHNIRLLLSNRTVKAKRGNRSVTKLRLEQYRLINHRRRQQQQNVARRMQEQKRNRYVQSNNESNLGEYVDRLIASKIAKLATTWKASSIAIPELEDIRESVEAGVKARAKHKFPNQFELQSKYAEKFRSTHHRWSYGRLSEFIKGAASSAGIPVEKGKQPVEGQLREKAIQVSLSAYYTRKAPSS